MKKAILFLICAWGVSAVSAQTYKSNIVGIRAGMNATYLSFDEELPAQIKRPAKFGWHVGVSDQILLSQIRPFYLETGLYLSNKGGGWKYSQTQNGITVKESLTLGMTYLQIPLRINYHIHGEGFTVEPYVGIHYALGLWGRSVYKTSHTDVNNPSANESSRETDKMYKDVEMRRSDLGVSVGFGATWSDFYAGIAWEKGFLDLDKNSSEKLRNSSGFVITVGYNF